MKFTYTCKHCCTEFVTRKQGKLFCRQACYFASKRNPDVTLTCTVCGKLFTVAFKFRGTKTCSPECTKASISRTLTTKVTKQCLACGEDFEIIRSYEETAKYCSYDPCFLSTRKTRQPDVEKTCECCGVGFVVPFTRNVQRFCGYVCANTGENNGMFGVTGEDHPMFGRPAWNRGLTVETDPRIRALGEKISDVLHEQFASGTRSHKGEDNPNFGHTADTLTSEQRENYSRAAIQRVLDGVSGYNTGHLTGTYVGTKSPPVKFKSSWELAMMMMWDRSPDVVSYAYEPTVIKIAEGRRAIPDFFVTRTNGDNGYVEIKPTAIQQLPEVAERLTLIRHHLEQRGMSYVLVGNDDIDAIKLALGKDLEDAIECYQGGSSDVRGGVPE